MEQNWGLTSWTVQEVAPGLETSHLGTKRFRRRGWCRFFAQHSVYSSFGCSGGGGKLLRQRLTQKALMML